MYGDFYYEDDETGERIDAQYYHQLKEQRRQENWDYSTLENAQTEREYEQRFREMEREFLSQTVLDKEVFKG